MSNKLRGELLAILQATELEDQELQRRLIETLLEPGQSRQMPYEEFLNWSDEDTLAEWIDGKIIMTSPASRQHQDLTGFLYQIMSTYVEMHDLGVIIQAPCQMKLARSGREPDLIFVAQINIDRLKSTYLDGPADLVVEIVSPESAGRDRGQKFYEYEEAHIPEYWLIDPIRRQAEFYQLTSQAQYRLISPDDTGVYHSPVLSGFWLQIAWLWQDPLPPTGEILLEIGGETYARRWIERLQKRGFLPGD